MKVSINNRIISFILCGALIFSVLYFVPGDSYADQSNLSEEDLLDKKTDGPDKDTDYDGFIVSIKDKEIDDVKDNELSEDIQSTGSEKYYLLDTTEEALFLASASAIETVEPNYIRYATGPYPPNDSYYRDSMKFNSDTGTINVGGAAKAFPLMGIDALWKIDLHGNGIHVAVLDTGINTHRDLDNPDKIIASPNNQDVKTSSINNDLGGHGTMVTSIINAKYNNEYNIAGIASEAEITSINVFTSDSKGLYATTWQTMNAYEYLLQDGNTPDVMNCSYGGSGEVTAERELLDELTAKGCIIIAANGNDGTSTETPTNPQNYTAKSYPAAYDCVIAVGATSAEGNISAFSSKNDVVDVSAWGDYVPVVSSSNQSGTSGASGTSFSSPIVAGIAACLKEQYPAIDKDLFLDLIIDTAVDKGIQGKDASYGYGYINASEMLGMIMSYDIEYHENGGKWNGQPYPTQYAFTSKETPLPSNIYSDSDLSFKGWYMDETLINGPYTAIPAKTKGYPVLHLYANWGTTSMISFNTGNGTSLNTQTRTIGDTYGELPSLTKTGYTFGGWYLDSAYKIKITDTTKVDGIDKTIYAKWDANPQKVTFNDRGEVTTKTYYYDGKLTGLSTPSRKGYTFSGWYTATSGGSKVSAATVVRSDINLYARWKAKTYTVKFNVNKGKKIKKKSKKVAYDKKYGSLPKPKRTGYKFKGWYTKKKGGKKVTAKTKLTTAKTHTLYARWKKA